MLRNMNKCAIAIVWILFTTGCDSFYDNPSDIEYKRPKPVQLRQATINWINRYGATSFLDELYCLIGHAPEVVVTQANVVMFAELGFSSHKKQVPFTITKSSIREVFKETDFDFTIATIREAVLAEADHVNLEKASIWFLDWVLASSRKLNSNLIRDEVMGIGWNDELYSSGQPRVQWVTFGDYLCTVILAEGADGAWSGSHYDTLPYNPKQIALLEKFANHHGGLKRAYLINWRPDHIRILRDKWPEAELLITDKSEKDVWFIQFRFVGGLVFGRYSPREVSSEWLDSLSPKNQAVDYRKSLLSFMLPSIEAEWKGIKFYKIAVAEPFRTNSK